VVKAFSDNPQRAKREFAGVRWKFHLRIDKLDNTQLVTGVVFSGDVGAATITMRSSREVEKLSRSKPAIIEAAVGEYLPGELYPFHFEGESPKVGAAINLDAVATRLNFDQDDKPLLVFSALKRR